MIKSDRQLSVTIEKLNSLKTSLKQKMNADVSSVLQKAGLAQIKSLIAVLQNEVSDYKSLKEDGVAAIKVRFFHDTLLVPIKFRIAKGMTQESFAKFVDISVRQIARYEAEDYKNISADTLVHILDKIPLQPKNDSVVEIDETSD